MQLIKDIIQPEPTSSPATGHNMDSLNFLGDRFEVDAGAISSNLHTANINSSCFLDILF